ncbi:MAG: hypothetical protein DBY17_04155 [Oscillospiraceae bacterium]|jgi:hypothetical protein|nr:MAG: hypothetical protein DBY17_04155 [Oscillospiraceae bacterium]
MLCASIPVSEAVFSYVSTPFGGSGFCVYRHPHCTGSIQIRCSFSKMRRGAVSAERAAFPKKGLPFHFK